MRARIIRMDGSTEQVSWPDIWDTRKFLSLLAPDCNSLTPVRLIENEPGMPGITAWLNPDAIFSKAENGVAYTFANAISFDPIAEFVAGDVLITGGLDSEGEPLGLTKEQDDILSEMIPRIAAGTAMVAA